MVLRVYITFEAFICPYLVECYTIWLRTKGPRNQAFVLCSAAFTGTWNPSCAHSFFFCPTDRPTDPPSREEGRWETKHFIGMAQRFRKIRSEVKWKGRVLFLPTEKFGITSGGGSLLHARSSLILRCPRSFASSSLPLSSLEQGGNALV